MATNLPPTNDTDSAAGTKLFFDTYGKPTTQFPATEVSAVIAFFEKKGFDETSAIVTASILLNQAKGEGVSIFKVLDNLGGYNDLQISALVAQILNTQRVPTSTLGYKVDVVQTDKLRNISA